MGVGLGSEVWAPPHSATHLPDPSSSTRRPGKVLGGSAGSSGTGEFVAAGFGVGRGGVLMWASDFGGGVWAPPSHTLA